MKTADNFIQDPFLYQLIIGGKGKISGFRGRMCEPRPVTTKPQYVGLTCPTGQRAAYCLPQPPGVPEMLSLASPFKHPPGVTSPI